MSVYDFEAFKNSSFAETITYTPSGSAAVSISAVVLRHGAQKLNNPGGISNQFYPIVIEIDRTDIATVTLQKDKVTCNDANGESKDFRVSKILYSDAGCFKLGLGL